MYIKKKAQKFLKLTKNIYSFVFFVTVNMYCVNELTVAMWVGVEHISRKATRILNPKIFNQFVCL